MGVGATHIDHIVISSNDSAATASLFATNLGLEIRRTMSRPGTGAHLEFAKLGEVVLEFGGPPHPVPGAEVKANLWGFVLAVKDMQQAVGSLQTAGYQTSEPRPAVQPGALITAVRGGTHGVPFALIQYNALPIKETAQ